MKDFFKKTKEKKFSHHLKGIIVKNFWYFIFWTFFSSWILWFPGILNSIFNLNISFAIIEFLIITGTFSPSICCIILVYKDQKKVGLSNFLREKLNFKIGKWYLPILIIIPGVYFIGYFIFLWSRHGTIPMTDLIQNPWKIPFSFLFMLFIGPINEEFGWRGYILPFLTKKYGEFNAAVILGIIWFSWHIPLFLIPGSPQNKFPIFQFAITLICFSFFMTWIGGHVNKSIIPAIIIHNFMNLLYEILPLMDSQGNYNAWISVNISFSIVCFFIVIWEKNHYIHISLDPQ